MTAHTEVAAAQELRESVIRGANELPGAIAIENEAGVVVRLDKLSRQRREALARQLLTTSGSRSTAAGAAASTGVRSTCCPLLWGLSPATLLC